MPIVDMPLEQLRAYRGINPRPADFDAYWEESLAEMRAIDPQISLAEADFCAPGLIARHLYFTGAHGARIHCKLLRPETIASPAPALLNFHGYTGGCPSWMQLAAYAYAGFVVAALDCRGQGGYSEDVGGVKGTTLFGHIIRGLDDPDPKKLLFRDVFLDAAQMAGIVMAMSEVDERRVGAFGGSQGGGLTLACAALEPRIVCAAPTYPFLCDYQRIWEMDLADNAYIGLREYFRHFDPTHAREAAVFAKLGYIDIHHLTPRIRARVLMATGLMDDVCPPSTQFAAYNAITSPKEVVVYPDFGHEGLPDIDDKMFKFLLDALR